MGGMMAHHAIAVIADDGNHTIMIAITSFP
jgi:hypothetical protein